MRKWTKQPPAETPLDRINPLTHGLVFAANILGPRIETYPSNKLVEAIGISTLPTTSGTFANLDTNTDYISFANDSIPDFVANGQDFSVLLYCQDGTLAGSNQRILQRTEDATNVDGFSITENSDTGDLRWTVRKTDVQSQIDSNSALSKTEPTVLIGTAKFVSGTDYDLVFWHGPEKSTATAATAIGVGDNDTFFIGKRRDTSDNPWVGAAGLLVVWDRVLADTEATALIQNPWQIFKRRQFALADVPDDVRFLPVEKPWTRQPPVGTPIDWSNPLTHGLRAAIVPHYDTWRDVVHNVFATMDDGATISVDQYGRHTDFDGNNDAVNMGRKYNNEIPNFDNAGGPHSSFLVINHDGSDGNFWGVRATGDVKLQLYTNDGDDFNYRSGAVSKEFSTTTFAANGYFTCGHSLGSTSDLRGYANGVQQGATTTQDGTPQTAAGANLEIGNHTQGFPYGGKIYCLFLWNRALTSEEHAALNDNPWQIFKPQIIHAPADVALPDLATFEKWR